MLSGFSKMQNMEEPLWVDSDMNSQQYNGFSFAGEEFTTDNSTFVRNGSTSGKISPVPDLLMPSLDIFSDDKIDFSSLMNEMGCHINTDDLMRMEPWAQLDNLLEDNRRSSSSGDSSPLNSPFSMEDSDQSPSGSLCGESSSPSSSLANSATEKHSHNSCIRTNSFPADVSGGGSRFDLEKNIQENDLEFSSFSTSGPLVHNDKATSGFLPSTSRRNSNFHLEIKQEHFEEKADNIPTSKPSGGGGLAAIAGQQLVTVTTTADGNNVVLLVPNTTSLSVDTKPNCAARVEENCGGEFKYLNSVSGGKKPPLVGPVRNVNWSASGSKQHSLARKVSQPYPEIRPRMSPGGSRSATPPDPVVPPIPQAPCILVQQPTVYEESAGVDPPAPVVPTLTLKQQDALEFEDSTSEKLFALKREQKKIRNREAAQQSRQRRKEYLESLQVQLEKIARENDRLQRENGRLRDENQKLKNVSALCSNCGGGKVKMVPATVLRPVLAKGATICLLALMLFLTVNLGPFLRFSPADSNKIPEPSVYQVDAQQFQSRALMSVRDDAVDPWVGMVEEENDEKVVGNGRFRRSAAPKIDEDVGGETFANSSGIVTSSDCIRLYFNQTESQRLTKELSSWVERHTYFRKILGNLKEKNFRTDAFLRAMEKEKRKNGIGRAKKAKSEQVDRNSERKLSSKELLEQQRPKIVGAGPSLGIWAESLNNAETIRDSSSDFSLQVFNSLDPYYMQLLQALRKRDDMFYLVSFRRDYMLLPASSSNNTAGRRPRMSLVVPALPLNETMLKGVPKDHIPMMQIECEVTATGLVNLPESLVPPFKGNKNSWEGKNAGKQERRSGKLKF